MFPVLSQYLLVNQSIEADPAQPAFASAGSTSGVFVGPPGVVAVNCEKLGLVTSTHHIKWNGGTDAGEVTIEGSGEVAEPGPWAVLQVVPFSGRATDAVVIMGAYGALRHRISSPIIGGTVTTKVVGTT